MIRILLKQLLDEKAFKERRRITLNEVSEATGISRPTLTRIANIAGYNTNTDTVDSLCFGGHNRTNIALDEDRRKSLLCLMI